jgi:hypothetical protein
MSTKKFRFLISKVIGTLMLLVYCLSCVSPQPKPAETITPAPPPKGEVSLPNNKVSPALLMQIQLRQKQISNPTAENLGQMKILGMNVDHLNVQRIYIYLFSPLTPAQSAELTAMGITLYADSWIPPTAQHPNGFILADMPVDSLSTLASKDYIAGLDTAERISEPAIR